jgi:transposase-like protein
MCRRRLRSPPQDFKPPRCPYPGCRRFKQPEIASEERPKRQFWHRHGTYQTRCRGKVPRFRCASCTRTFSYQTFRHDYRDKKPHLNAEVFDRLVASGGLRETAFRVHLTRNNLEQKHRKIARTLGPLHQNMMRDFPKEARFLLDEMESFEDTSYFVVGTDCAPIRPRGRMTPDRRRAIARDELRFGKRRDRSIPCLRRLLGRLVPHVRHHEQVWFGTDQKAVYRPLARQAFGARRLIHETTSSKAPRTTWNPLFLVNLTEAISRDYNGRLRRRTWLCSKQERYLREQLHLLVTFRNYIRPRTRKPRERRVTPATRLGFARRRLGFADCLSWRQEWGELSIRPDQPGTVCFADSPRRRR